MLKLNKINKSDLVNLKIDEEIIIDNGICVYAITKKKIFDGDYLIFGIYGGGSEISTMPINEFTTNDDLFEFANKINNYYDINFAIYFD